MCLGKAHWVSLRIAESLSSEIDHRGVSYSAAGETETQKEKGICCTEETECRLESDLGSKPTVQARPFAF